MRKILFLLGLLIPVTVMADFESLRQQIRHDYLTPIPSEQTVLWNQHIRNDGTWGDIDYTDRSRSLWQLEKHLDRLVDMSLAYEQSTKKDRRLLKNIKKGLHHWFKKGYRNDNWWYPTDSPFYSLLIRQQKRLCRRQSRRGSSICASSG